MTNPSTKPRFVVVIEAVDTAVDEALELAEKLCTLVTDHTTFTGDVKALTDNDKLVDIDEVEFDHD